MTKTVARKAVKTAQGVKKAAAKRTTASKKQAIRPSKKTVAAESVGSKKAAKKAPAKTVDALEYFIRLYSSF